MACYETRETLTEQGWSTTLVSMDSATLFKDATIAVDTDHPGLAQAQKKEAGMFDDIVGVSRPSLTIDLRASAADTQIK